jgi:hypothetical protein
VLPETNAATAVGAGNARIDQFNPGVLKRGNQLHEGVDVAADDAIARFHALDGGDGKVCELGGLPLIDIQQRSSRPELVGRNHEMAASGGIRIEYVYTTPIMVSSINLDAQYIKHQEATLLDAICKNSWRPISCAIRDVWCTCSDAQFQDGPQP